MTNSPQVLIGTDVILKLRSWRWALAGGATLQYCVSLAGSWFVRVGDPTAGVVESRLTKRLVDPARMSSGAN